MNRTIALLIVLSIAALSPAPIKITDKTVTFRPEQSQEQREHEQSVQGKFATIGRVDQIDNENGTKVEASPGSSEGRAAVAAASIDPTGGDEAARAAKQIVAEASHPAGAANPVTRYWIPIVFIIAGFLSVYFLRKWAEKRMSEEAPWLAR